MAEIFISYKSERRRAAEHLAKILERYGYTVWFDYHLVKGDDFADEIDRRIREAKALVVLWCKLSVQSVWVRREAALGARLRILVPTMIEPCELRVDFASDDYTDLSGWNGAPASRELFRLLDGIAHRVGRQPQLDYKAMRDYWEDWHRFGAPSLRTFALGAPVKTLVETQAGPLPAAPAQPANPGNSPAPATIGIVAHDSARNHAAEDWKAIEFSADPRDFRLFIEEHKSGFWVRKAQYRLADLAQATFAAAGRNKAALEHFLKAHFDSGRAKDAQALLAEIAQEERVRDAQAEKLRRQVEEARQEAEREARYRSEGRIQVAAAFPEPEGIEWFLPGAGKTEWFKDLGIGPEMVVVPAGSFLMGSPPDEPERYGNESPQHKVTIPRPFAMGRFAVTFAEWDAAQEDKDWQAITGRAPRQPEDEGWGRADRPVINVDWDDAKAYAKWLSAKTGNDYRLPSEAEWEYACRAGSVTPFWWGKSVTPKQANYNARTVYKGGGEADDWLQKTLLVKSFDPNPWGLCQVHGNVWEWCEDLWHDNYQGAPADGSAWLTGATANRVMRGGSWYYRARHVRAACRDCLRPEDRSIDAGFRCTRVLR